MTLRVTVKKDDLVYDISAAELFFTLKMNPAQGDDKALIAKKSGQGISIDNGPLGIAFVQLDATDTDHLLPDRKLYYDVQLKTATGEIHTVDSGTFIVKQDVTKSTS